MNIYQRGSALENREKKLLASFIVDFKKGKKTADPMEYAKTCKALSEMYGSAESVAEKLGVGKETVRILSKIVELPEEVQEMISRHLIPITVAFDLVPLSRERQIEAAGAISGLSFKDARKVIRRLSESPNIPATDVRVDVLNELEKKEVDIAMIALPKEIYALLREESEDIPEFISNIVEKWLAEDAPLDRYAHATDKGNNVSLMIKLSRRTFGALRRKTRKPANLVERIVISHYKDKLN